MRIFKERTEWFDIPNDPHKGRMKIVYLNEGQQQVLAAKCRKLSFVFVDGKEEGHMVPDEIKLREEGVDARVRNWENQIGGNGEKLECNKANKISFSCEDGFMTVLKDMIEKLDKIVKEEREQEEKNFLSLQDGSQESIDNPVIDA